MTYGDFAAKVIRAGLMPRECMSNHWQILRGRYRVNVWPHSKRGFQMQREGQKSQRGSLKAAITLAEPPDRTPTTDEPAPWEAPAETAQREVGLIRRFWRWLY